MLIVFIAEFMFISFYIHPHFFLDLLCAICLLVCMLLLLFLSICTKASWLARMICASIQGTNFGNDCVNPARMLCVIPVFLLPSCNRRWQRNTHITHHLQMMFPIKSAGHFHCNLIKGYLKSLDCSPTPNTETGIGAMGSYPSWFLYNIQHFFMERFPLSFRTLNRRHRWTRSCICLHAGPIQVPFSRETSRRVKNDGWSMGKFHHQWLNNG